MSRDEPTERFSDRAEAYVRSRPGYPAGVLDVLERDAGLRPGRRVADLGSGTGIFSALLLERGAEVFAVEPNSAMRAAAERQLSGAPGFHSVAATAENTSLCSGSIELVVAAQAFHWFDPVRVRAELLRIARTGAHAALIWNERLVEASPFSRDYEAMLQRHSIDYAQVDHRRLDAARVTAFFAPHRVWRAEHTCRTSPTRTWPGYAERGARRRDPSRIPSGCRRRLRGRYRRT